MTARPAPLMTVLKVSTILPIGTKTVYCSFKFKKHMTKQLPVNQMLQVMFTEEEWDAIYNAMADYQDHGEEETELAYSVQSKITTLFS